MLCYSIDKPETFDIIPEEWVSEIHKHASLGTPFILVGTKADSRPSEENTSQPACDIELSVDFTSAQPQGDPGRRFVTIDEGKLLAKAIGASAFIECSARDGSNLNELLTCAAELSLKRFHKKKRQKKRDMCVIS